VANATLSLKDVKNSRTAHNGFVILRTRYKSSHFLLCCRLSSVLLHLPKHRDNSAYSAEEIMSNIVRSCETIGRRRFAAIESAKQRGLTTDRSTIGSNLVRRQILGDTRSNRFVSPPGQISRYIGTGNKPTNSTSGGLGALSLCYLQWRGNREKIRPQRLSVIGMRTSRLETILRSGNDCCEIWASKARSQP
jgi:hypothetical protein